MSPARSMPGQRPVWGWVHVRTRLGAAPHVLVRYVVRGSRLQVLYLGVSSVRAVHGGNHVLWALECVQGGEGACTASVAERETERLANAFFAWPIFKGWRLESRLATQRRRLLGRVLN